LCRYISGAELESFQPMKANFGLLPELEDLPRRTGKREKHALLAERALKHFREWMQDESI
jgi:methylenetetrahydrofolate--tRNA-(uracil-5-)-methyltransferase